MLFFNCGFMNGKDDTTIFNSTLIRIILQDGKYYTTNFSIWAMIMLFFLPDIIQLEHSFSYLRVFNNTVINRLEEESFTTPTPNHKRGSPVENSLYVDCDASQGNHQPMWVTLNPSVGGPTGIISAGNDSFGVEILSDYMARLFFNYFDPTFEGVYRCLSAQSGNFVEIFITTGNHTLTLIECDNQLQFSFLSLYRKPIHRDSIPTQYYCGGRKSCDTRVQSCS